jgi:hypothetical protein
VRLALGSTVSNCSAKIRRAHTSASQKKRRRAHKISAIRTPHRQMIVAALIAMVKPLSSFTALSTTKPRGTSSEKSNLCIALIPNPNQNQIGASISSDLSQGLIYIWCSHWGARRRGMFATPLMGCHPEAACLRRGNEKISFLVACPWFERRERGARRAGLDGHSGQSAANLLPGMQYAVKSRHSTYSQTLRYLSAQGVPVIINARVARWRCRNQGCDRRIFTERVPDLATPFARKTARLADIVRLLGHSTGGRPSERLMERLDMPIGDTTILRNLKGIVERTPG